MKFNNFMTPLIVISMLGSILLFQNCGQMQTLSSSSFSSSSSWFDYPYTEKPEVYAEFYFFRTAQLGTTGLQDYTYVGGIAPSQDSASGVFYTITFKTPAGAIVCPTITGNTTSFQGTCTGVTRVSNIVVDISVQHNGITHEYQKIF